MPDTRYIGFAEETTFKTAVAAAKYVDHVRESIVPDIGWIEADTVERRAITKRVTGPWMNRGTLDCIVEPENVGHLFKWSLGDYSVSGAGTFTHVFKTLEGTLKSFTLRVGSGATPNFERLLAGSIVNSVRLEARIRDLLRGTWDIIAAKKESRTTIGSPTLSTLSPFVWRQCVATIAGLDKSAQVQGFNVTLENNWPADNLYAFNTDEIVSIADKIGRATVTGEVTLLSDDVVQYDALVAGTEFTLKFDFVGPSPYRLTVDLPKCVYNRDVTPHPERREVPITLTAPFTARHDATDSIMKVTLINQVATY